MNYHLGWYLNRYAGSYYIEHFTSPRTLVQWLVLNADRIDGAIDFISEK